MVAAVTTSQWLLMFHITGAFFLVGGSVAAAVLNTLSQQTDKPAEIALYLKLIRFALPLILLGAFLTLVFGLWLVHEDGYAFFTFWVIAALVLWVLSSALGAAGGRHQEKARELAEQLGAAEASSDELRTLLRDPRGNAMSWLAGLATLLLLVDMIWKPGA
jgi:uncharacterized membrane protein